MEREGGSRSLSHRDIWDFVLLGVCGQVVTQLFGAWGTRLSLASNGALLGLTAPISTAAIAYFLLGERMSRLRWASFILAIVGVLECSGINWKGADLASRRFLLGNLMLFVSVFGSAFYNVYSKRLLRRHLPLEILLYSYYSAAAFMLPIGIFTEPHFFMNIPHFTLVVWLGFALLTIFHYFLSMVIFLNVLTRIDAMLVGLSNYLIPFFGLVVAAVVLHERLTKFMVVGGLLILASTLLVTVYEER
jgi:drug/metabolite transporter (DMT)-like permease